MDELSTILFKLQTLVEQGRFEELESDVLEFKPCPSTGADWSERYKSVNAFLNTRGGLLILGIKESGQGADRKYVVTGYDHSAEDKLKELRNVFTNSEQHTVDVSEYLPPPEISAFMGQRIAVQRVDALPAQMRYVFFKGHAYERILTGDHKLKQAALVRQAEYLEEIAQARELEPLGTEGLECVDLERLNEYILQLNQSQKIENLKPTLEDAIPFLTRKRFLIDGRLTLLGGLVCGAYPGDLMGFRVHVHGYVHIYSHTVHATTIESSLIVNDKQNMVTNVLPLLEQANAYVLRNIQVGIAPHMGGTARAEFPQAVLRETINNALAHRDYSINKQVVISIIPGKQIEISNPGKFREQLLLVQPSLLQGKPPLLRVLPETKPRNPRLADVLRVFHKWEGRGIGMATLVNLCLENKLNLPYFKFKTDEVSLVLQAGELLDVRMLELFESRDAYIAKKLGPMEELTLEKKAVLAYFIKSEWANLDGRYCVLLTPDNNHTQAIKVLQKSGLVYLDERSTPLHPVYLADRVLHAQTFENVLLTQYGTVFEQLSVLGRKVLSVIYRYNMYSSKLVVNAKQVGLVLWAEDAKSLKDIWAYDDFASNVRKVFNLLEKQGIILREVGRGKKIGYVVSFLSRSL